MKFVFVFTFLANVGLTLFSLAILPPRMATHFGVGGMADNWEPNYVHALVMTGIHVLLFASLYFSPRLISWFPPRLINLPNKEYWLRPERLPQTQATIGHYIWQFGAVIFLFLCIVSCLVILANLSDPVRIHEPSIYISLAALLIYTATWVTAFYRAFKLPKEQRL